MEGWQIEMRKVFFLGLVLATIAWGASRMIPPSKPSVVDAQGFAQTTQKPATFTPSPLPTVDFAASLQASDMTRVAAVETANEAGRINAQATAQHEQALIDAANLTLENNKFTAEADAANLLRQSWTATAYLTSVPLTKTQQVIVDTKEAARQTATKEYPTQIMAVQAAQNAAKCGMPCYLFGYFPGCAIGIFCIGLIVYLFTRIKMDMDREERKREKEETDLTPHLYAVEDQPGNYRRKKIVPCSEDQLSELAEMVVNGERTLGINRLETESRTFRSKRDDLKAVRNFLVRKDVALAYHPKQTKGDIVLNDAGVAFFEHWFDSHELPAGFYFAEDEGEEPEHIEEENS